MSRRVPTEQEQEAIDLLTLAGYKVVRARTHDALRERTRVAEATARMADEQRESCERWARNCLDEERRLSRRLDAVCTGAAALGVPITAINEALGVSDPKDS